MLNKIVNKIFPCEKIIHNLIDMHEDAKHTAIDSSRRVIKACDSLDGKLCGIAAPYTGQERRKQR